MSVDPQEVVALVLAAGAALYVIRRLTGWPKKRKPPVRPTGRLGRGLDRARKSKRNRRRRR